MRRYQRARDASAAGQLREAWRGCLPLVLCTVAAACLPHYLFGVSWWITIPLSPAVGWGINYLLFLAMCAVTLAGMVLADFFRGRS